MPPRTHDVHSLLAHTVKTDTGCLEWQGCRNKQGYGIVGYKKRCYLAHRLLWTLKNSPVTRWELVCHSCDNPSCINIEHLFLGTPKDNMIDKMRKGRYFKPEVKFCFRGHDLAEAWKSKAGRRYCRKCRNITERAERKSLGAKARRVFVKS